MKQQVLFTSIAMVGILVVVVLRMFVSKKPIRSSSKKKDIQALIRQTARWAAASQQDKAPMIAVLHANYAAGYLQALETIATENEINQFTDLRQLRVKVYSVQDKAALKAISACPQYMGEDIDKQLAMIGVNVQNDFTSN